MGEAPEVQREIGLMARLAGCVVCALFGGALLLAAPAAAQTQSRCADCHFANPSPGEFHVSGWDLSAHGREGVGCESCHGGDATTYDVRRAHRGILAPGNPASPTNYFNLAETCGKCHARPYRAFQESRHAELLNERDPEAPTCTTCHSEEGAYLLSSRGLERRCNACHGEGKRAPAAGRPSLARTLHHEVVELRKELKTVRKTIARTRPAARRQALEERLASVDAPLSEGIQAAHDFTFDRFQERLGVARQRLDELLEVLANDPQR